MSGSAGYGKVHTAISAINAGLAVLAPLGMFVYFSHHLTPAVMGVMAFCLAWIEVLKALCPNGLYEALLVDRDADRSRDAAAGGVLMACALGAFGIYLGVVLFALPHMGAAAAGLGLAAMIVGGKLAFDTLAQHPTALLARRQAYGAMASRGLMSNVGGIIIGLGLSDRAGPVWGMVGYYLGQSMLNWVAVIAAGGGAAVSLRWRQAAPLMPVAWMSSQVRAIGTLNNFFDQVLIGAFLTPATLAMYNLGKRVDMAQIAASQAFVATLYQPRFAAHSGDGLSDDFRKALVMMTFLFGVPSAVLMLHANTVVSLVFGTQWLPAVPVVQAMAIGGYSRVIANVQGAYFSTHGHNRLLRNRTLISTAMTIALVALAHWIGMAEVAWAITAKNIAVCLWSAGLTRHLSSLRDFGMIVIGLPLVGLIGAMMVAVLGGALAHAYGWSGTVALWAVSGGVALLIAGVFHQLAVAEQWRKWIRLPVRA